MSISIMIRTLFVILIVITVGKTTKVGIIGSGIGSASLAYFLKTQFRGSNESIDIDIYESSFTH